MRKYGDWPRGRGRRSIKIVVVAAAGPQNFSDGKKEEDGFHPWMRGWALSKKDPPLTQTAALPPIKKSFVGLSPPPPNFPGKRKEAENNNNPKVALSDISFGRLCQNDECVSPRNLARFLPPGGQKRSYAARKPRAQVLSCWHLPHCGGTSNPLCNIRQDLFWEKSNKKQT